MITRTKTKTKTRRQAQSKQARGKKKAVIAAPVVVRVKKISRKTASHKRLLSRVIDLRPCPVRANQVPKAIEHKRITSPYSASMPRLLLKLVAIMLVVSLNSVGLSGISYTKGHYSDTESTVGNFSAGILDSVLSNTDFQGVVSNDPGDESPFETNISLADGGLSAQYTVEYEKTGGNDNMCNALALSATGNALSYHGALSAFALGTTTDLGLWSFVVTVLPSESVVAGETCEFDLVYKTWIDGAPLFETSGFNDKERFHISIEAAEVGATVVINEFLPKPDGVDYGFDFGNDSSDMPKGEWVELYNLTGDPIDLTDWYVQDASGGVGNTQITNLNTLSATTIIPAHGFLVIYMNKSVWNNTGDVVKLFNASDALQDSYAYTSAYDYCYLAPTPGGTNDEVPSGAGIDCTPGATIPKNKSYARIPDGTGSWVDPIPTPGVKNSLDDAEASTLIEQFEQALAVRGEGASYSEPEAATSTNPLQVSSEQATSTEAILDETTSTEVSTDEEVMPNTPLEEVAPVVTEIVTETVDTTAQILPSETIVSEPEPAIEPASVVELPAVEPPPVIE